MNKERVELHCHTNMTALEGVSSVEELISKANELGQKALAITDRFGVHAFPDAYEALKKLNLTNEKFKVIYGTEILINDGSVQRTIDDATYSYVDLCRVIILVKNQVGLENLYKIISCVNSSKDDSAPEMSKDFLNKYREGLLFGCCLFKGQLAVAYLNGFSEDTLLELAEFYDFLEIETDSNTRFQYDRYYDIETHSDLYDNLNRTILDVGRKTGKLVIASANVYYTDASQEMSYRILQDTFECDDNVKYFDHHLMSTEEMLESFKYLGEDIAKEVVVDNTNKIADMIEDVIPISEEKHFPQIPDADNYVREMSYIEARRFYGEELPSVIKERLEKEINGIIQNGYSSIYVIYARLAEECQMRGYLNGTRGCVGSSLVAYLLGITGTNPLPPHYLCRKCSHSDFEIKYDSSFRRGYIGADLPDKKCPLCGKKMRKDGYDISAEIFMGINYDKEPDFELNVAYELQEYIQKYTKRIDGISDVDLTGIINRVPYTMACEIVGDYYKNHKDLDEDKDNSEIIIDRLTDVKLETGVHPIRLFLLPEGLDINKVTPLSSASCDDTDGEFLKTHFEYWKIQNNLQTVSICTNVVFTMLKRLEECTGVNPDEIPLHDDKMISLFESPDALGVTEKQIRCTVGTIGACGFESHDFIYGIVPEAKPKNLSEIISGFGFEHGTGTWIDNAYDLIEGGNNDITTLIAFRDDIYMYLVNKGIDKETAYSIMEHVRKGKAYRYGLKEEWIALMKEHGVPDWYIDSCKKIRYLFPKAHAAVYALMSWRILYYKLYHPEAFYIVWLERYAKHVDIGFVRAGQEHAKKEFDQILEKLSNADENISDQEDMEYSALEEMRNEISVVLEIYARGVDVESVVSLVNAKQQKKFC